MRAWQQQPNQMCGNGEMFGCQSKGAKQTISDTEKKTTAAAAALVTVVSEQHYIHPNAVFPSSCSRESSLVPKSAGLLQTLKSAGSIAIGFGNAHGSHHHHH